MSQDKLKLTVSDNFADHNIGAIGMFVMNALGQPKLKLCIGLKKYTKDPSSVDSLLFGHSYFYMGDVEEGFREIAKFDFERL